MLETIQQAAGWGYDGMVGFIIPFLIVLSLLVFVHEWGHYIVARLCGVRVETFSIGFGKELYGWTDKKGTRWKISLIPLGGYVQMFGDTDAASASHIENVKEDGEPVRPMKPEERAVAFFAKPVWKRAAIVFAGPAVNFIFAIILLSGMYMAVGKPVDPPVAAAIIADGAADQAGIQPHDRIIAIDGKPITSFSEIQRQVTISLNRPLDITLLRDGQEVQLDDVTPRLEELEDRFGFKHSRGLLGILGTEKAIHLENVQSINGRNVSAYSVEDKRRAMERVMDRPTTIGLPTGTDEIQIIKIHAMSNLNNDPDNFEGIVLTESLGKEMVDYQVFSAIGAAVKESWAIITGTLEAIGQIFAGTRSTDELGGLIRIGAIAGDAAQTGLIAIITFTALLSINLGLINLFPIPLLDGGHLVFYAFEAVRGKPLPHSVQEFALKFGMILLVGLMAFANLNDILQMIL